jgi:ubiquinone/menaquinone biosynthesis C-methylase UbiE
MNYFAPQTAAERYAKGRPDFHGNTIQHIKTFLNYCDKVDRALDIACGTGLSTKALLQIANHVYGTDISQQMLSLATRNNQIHYSFAPAEQQPFPDSDFDLITVSSGVHWFDIDRFLLEAKRLLKPQSWLVLYENYFLFEMEGAEEFSTRFAQAYLEKYPSPPRNNAYKWTNENLHSKGFNFMTEERFKNSVVFTKQQLLLYFTTQSNIIAAVENGFSTYEEVESWLSKELSQFFPSDDSERTINYGNWIKFIQKSG